MITDYFALEPLIIARLKAAVAELKDVTGNGDKDFENTSYLPSAIVVHDGLFPVSRNNDRQTADQRWVVVLLIASPNDSTGSAARAQAGGLMIKIKNALVGWSPMADAQEFALTANESETYTQDGIALFPMAFNIRLTI